MNINEVCGWGPASEDLHVPRVMVTGVHCPELCRVAAAGYYVIALSLLDVSYTILHWGFVNKH
jgi:hypothetical protein